MKVQVKYYNLIEDKKMGDGNIIPLSQDLLLINKDTDGMLFFETESELKVLFWANDSEVVFSKEVEEDWSDEKIIERNKYINGEFL